MKSMHKPLRRTAVATVVSLAFVAQAAWAVAPFVVKDIKVEGLQRVDAGTIFASIPVKVGDTYDDDKGSASIRALYALGLFQDVKVEPRGDELVVVVQERPTVNLVEVSSTSEFDKKALLAGLGNAGVAAGRPYDKAAEDLAVQEIRRQYQNRGFYGTEVISTVTPIERNRVNVNYTIHEGYSARIKDVRIIGNRAFSESTLRDLMQQDTGGWMSWYTKSDRYAAGKFNTDLEAIRNHYLNHGYLEFAINSAQVALSPDKRDITITIDLTEGPRYAVSGVSLTGNYLNKEDEFKSLVAIKPGEAYKVDDVAATVKAMTEHFGSYGYAFAKIAPQPLLDREKQQVALVLQATPGQRAYVRRINVSGNTKTRDEVVRREFRQFESSWYNAEKVRLSRDRVDRLGYFTDVAIDTQPVPGTSDQADLLVAVKEKPTGALQVGAGYSSSDKLSLSFGISQDNIFGSGQSLSADVNTSKYNRTVSLSSTDPYFTTDGVSRTFGVSYNLSKPYDAQGYNLFDYSLRHIGGNVSFGVPFTENDTVFFGAGAEQYKIQRGSNSAVADAYKLPTHYQNYIDSTGKSTASGMPFTVGWSRDSRDSALAPSRGIYQRLSGAISPAGDMRYALATYRYQYYYPLTRQYTLAFNTDLAYGKGLGSKAFPVFKNLYSGGLGSVRGFEDSSLGMYSTASNGTTYALGGNRKFNVNLEFITPFPGAGNEKTLRLFGFLDAGQVYAENTAANKAWYDANPDARKIRASYGFGIRWISPMGPLSLAFGFPLKKYTGDKLQKVQFQIGTTF